MTYTIRDTIYGYAAVLDTPDGRVEIVCGCYATVKAQADAVVARYA